MTYKFADHDIGITRTSGTNVGLMLLRDRNGNPLYKEYAEPILAPQRFDGTPDISFQPPDREVPIILDDFREGFGQRIYDTAEPKRYYYTINGDARFKGEFILGPLAATVTKPSTPSDPTITDGNLELWDDAATLTNWTETGAGTLSRDGTNQEQGTFCAQMAAGAMTVYQDVDSTNDYAGVEVVFTARGYATVAGRARVGVEDGTTTLR